LLLPLKKAFNANTSIFGKQVVVKETDYHYLTVFIKGDPSFQITEDEAAILNDLILSLKGQKVYGA